MKRLILTLILVALAFTTRAQTVTNITIKSQVDVVVTGVSTNSTTDNLVLTAAGSKKDANRINGLAYAFSQYRANGGKLALGAWLKQDAADRADGYATAKQQADNSAMLAKLQYLLGPGTDLLTAGDLSNLATIAAKAP